MLFRWLTILATFVVVIAPLSVQSQYDRYQFENISAQLGQLYTAVHHVYQDKTGFLWFATDAGLFRFDGYELKAYRHDVYNPASISAQVIWHVMEDKDERIWVSTTYGLNLFDKRSNTFQHFFPVPGEHSTKLVNMVRRTHQDANGTLWVAGYSNLYQFDPLNNSFTLIKNIDAASDENVVYSFFNDDNRGLFCGTNKGLIYFESGQTEYSHLAVSSDSLANVSVRSIIPNDGNSLWLASNRGLLLYDIAKEEVIKRIVDPERQHQRVVGAIRISNGDILMGFDKEGLALYHPADDALYTFRHNEDIASSLHNDDIWDLFEDEFDNIWIGTTLGIARMNTRAASGQLMRNTRGLNRLSNHVNRIHVDRTGRIWSVTDDGIYVKPAMGSSSSQINLLPSNKAALTTDWIYENENGDMYIPIDGEGILTGNSRDLMFSRMPLSSTLSRTRTMKIVGDNS